MHFTWRVGDCGVLWARDRGEGIFLGVFFCGVAVLEVEFMARVCLQDEFVLEVALAK